MLTKLHLLLKNLSKREYILLIILANILLIFSINWLFLSQKYEESVKKSHRNELLLQKLSFDLKASSNIKAKLLKLREQKNKLALKLKAMNTQNKYKSSYQGLINALKTKLKEASIANLNIKNKSKILKNKLEFYTIDLSFKASFYQLKQLLASLNGSKLSIFLKQIQINKLKNELAINMELLFLSKAGFEKSSSF